MKILNLPILALLLVPFSHASELATASLNAEAFYKASNRHDLKSVSHFLHPKSLAGHRTYINISLAKLRKTYGAEAVDSLVGLKESELSALTDLEYFTHTVKVAFEITESSPAPERNSFKVIGEINDGVSVHTTTLFYYTYAAEGEKMNLRRAESLSFLKDEGEWRITSFPYVHTVTRAYTDELIRSARIIK